MIENRATKSSGVLLGMGLSIVCGLMLALFALMQPWQRPDSLFLDLATVAQVSPLIGSISYVSDTVWFAAGFICFFTAACTARARSFMLASGALTFLLATDDMFLLHDYFFPRFLGSEEMPMKIIHVSSTLAYIGYFSSTIRRHGLALFAFANLCLFLSLAMDNHFISSEINKVYLLVGTPQVLLEDGFKTIGIFAWSAFLALSAYDLMSEQGVATTAMPEATRLTRQIGPARASKLVAMPTEFAKE